MKVVHDPAFSSSWTTSVVTCMLCTFENPFKATATSDFNDTDDPPIRAQPDQLPFTSCAQ